MTVIEGRFAEARVYLRHAVAVLFPGIELPTFGSPATHRRNRNAYQTEDDLKLVLEEGRRQLDRQFSDLKDIRSRAGKLLTVGLAEVGVLAASAQLAFPRGALLLTTWALSMLLALLSVGGAASLIVSRAPFGGIETSKLARVRTPVLGRLADSYARSVGEGEETIRTWTTVLRDAVLLAVVAAILYAGIWSLTSLRPDASKQPATPTPGVPSCSPTCTTFSPNPSVSPNVGSPTMRTTTQAPASRYP